MSYLTVVAHVGHVESLNGTRITCNYLAHRRFSENCMLCQGLHYAFVRFVPDRTYSRGYSLRTGIQVFLDFVIEYESGVPPSMRLRGICDITAEVFRAFDQYARKYEAPQETATRFGAALVSVAESFEEGMPLLVLPKLPGWDSVPREPLTEDGYRSLRTALKRAVLDINRKFRFRQLVDSSDPYFEGEWQPFIGKLHRWHPSAKRSLRTLIEHGHPFDVALEEFQRAVRSAMSRAEPRNVVEAIYGRYTSCLAATPSPAPELSRLGELLGAYYPTPGDQAAVVYFIELQSGWNKEIVLAIDPENYEHPLTGAIETQVALVTSEKERSQGRGKPYADPKTFVAASDRHAPYSIYSLIQLAKGLSAPLADVAIEATSEFVRRHHKPLFLCMRTLPSMLMARSRTGSLPGRVLSIGNRNLWMDGARDFFEKYEVVEGGERLQRAKDLEGRLRPTWIQQVRIKEKLPISVISLTQGHKEIETTDVHYDNSGAARQARRDRLRGELEEIGDLLKRRIFKGLIAHRGSEPIPKAHFRIFVLPGHERALWTCMDATAPDWPGSKQRVAAGQRCSEIPQCLFCRQVCITEDSLPFLLRRQEIVHEELIEHVETEARSRLEQEADIISYIFDEWRDSEALKRAARYRRAHPALLPRNLGELRVLFEG